LEETKSSEEFILELALRALAAQSREGIAATWDYSVDGGQPGLEVGHYERRRKLVDEFNIEAAWRVWQHQDLSRAHAKG